MVNDDWEILEIAGAFHFAFSLVPQHWYDLQSKPVQLGRDEHCQVIETWWQNYQPTALIRDYCDSCLIRSDGSPWEFTLIETVWTDENHHRVELWEKDHNDVAHLDIKIDVRYPFVDFLARAVDLANRTKCLFYLSYEDDFVEATSIAIFEALNRSPAAKLEKRRLDGPRSS